MKLKAIASAFAAIILCSNAIAGTNNATQQKDTTKVLFAAAKNIKNGKLVIKERNVVYPTIWEEHREESADFVKSYASKRASYVSGQLRSSKKYLSKINTIFKKYGVPSELAWLMALESGFNPTIVSHAGAVGYWQFMDGTAKDYGLQIVEQPSKEDAKKIVEDAKKSTDKKPIDERMNFTKSTHAAARYFRDLSKSFDKDWLLVAASYNWGIGNVKRVIRNIGKPNATFWDIKNYLPAETRNYVLNLISLNVVIKNYNNYVKNNLVFDDILMDLPKEETL